MSVQNLREVYCCPHSCKVVKYVTLIYYWALMWVGFFLSVWKSVLDLGCVLSNQDIRLCLLLIKCSNFQVMDDRKIRRQICVSTWQTAKNKKNLRVVHLKFPTSWDYININLAEVTAALFGTKYVETVGIKVSVGRPDGPRQRWHLFTITHFTSWFCSFPCRFMQTVEYGMCISQTDCTLTKSCQVITRWRRTNPT